MAIIGKVMNTFAALRFWFAPRYAKFRYILLSQSFNTAGSGGRIGAGVRISPMLKFDAGARIALRDRVFLGGRGQLSIGDDTTINEGCMVSANAAVDIGANVMLAANVYILDTDHNFADRSTPISRQGYTTEPVKIEDGVWIGTGAVITKGITISEGAIIGANSVVTKDVEAFSIWGGIPAKRIGSRPDCPPSKEKAQEK